MLGTIVESLTTSLPGKPKLLLADHELIANLKMIDETNAPNVLPTVNIYAGTTSALKDVAFYSGQTILCNAPWLDSLAQIRTGGNQLVAGPSATRAVGALYQLGETMSHRMRSILKDDEKCIMMFGFPKVFLLGQGLEVKGMKEEVDANASDATKTDAQKAAQVTKWQELYGTALYDELKAIGATSADSLKPIQARRVLAKYFFEAAAKLTMELQGDAPDESFAEIFAYGSAARQRDSKEVPKEKGVFKRVVALQHAVNDFVYLVRLYMPQLDFQMITTERHGRHLLGFTSKNNADAYKALAADANCAEVSVTICCNAALLEANFTTLQKTSAMYAYEIKMAWCRVLVVAGVAVPADVKLSNARLELVTSQQLSQHVHKITDHAQNAFYERKTSFMEPETGAYVGNPTGKYEVFKNRTLLGAWRIGSVLDTAASPITHNTVDDYYSRSTMHSSAVFADRVNVNVSWWPAHRLANSFGRKAMSWQTAKTVQMHRSSVKNPVLPPYENTMGPPLNLV
jgi:hypothetical protein